ncbi:hypothetical protein G6F56_004775 [Rhizopus delemar]|nr:hypothetical protein G6F56_004775 [Rhizopus delemar]
MSKFRKPKCPSSLKGRTIRNDLRVTLELLEFLFVSDYSSWDVSATVHDYFLSNQPPDKTDHDLFELAVQSLQNFIDSEHTARLEEVEIAGNEFVGDHICEKAEKRKLNDLVADTDTRPLKFQIKSKTYDIQSPQNAAVLDSPVIEESNMNTLSRRVNICLRNSTNFASPELLEEYRGPQNDHRKNLNLLKVYYSLAFFYQVPRA